MSGLKILLFIVLSLVLWVLISGLVHIAYVLLPGGPAPASWSIGEIFNMVTAGAGIRSGWYFLVLPLAMVIAGVWVWPAGKATKLGPGDVGPCLRGGSPRTGIQRAASIGHTRRPGRGAVGGRSA